VQVRIKASNRTGSLEFPTTREGRNLRGNTLKNKEVLGKSRRRRGFSKPSLGGVETRVEVGRKPMRMMRRVAETRAKPKGGK